MKNFFTGRLGVRLFFSFLIVIILGALALAAVSGLTLRRSFNRHMGSMMAVVIPERDMPMQGRAPGPRVVLLDVGDEDTFFRNFRAGFVDALLWGGLVAGLTALGASLYLSRRILSPIHDLTVASQRIATGKYDERVQVQGNDELADLGNTFNQMAAQLQQVESMRQRLIGDVSHELRTPLTSIKGYMDGLMDGVVPAAPETYMQIYQEADRLSRLVDDLQELSRVEAGAVHLELRPVNLEDVFSSVAKRLKPQYDAKAVTLEASLPPGLPLLRADIDRLIQVLTNLVGNALQYTPSGGRVTLSAEKQPGFVLVMVTDTGAGISAQDLPHVFDRFYRADKSRSRQSGGSGVGLTIARHLVEAHGGELWAESDGPGSGSRFSFTLPVSAA